MGDGAIINALISGGYHWLWGDGASCTHEVVAGDQKDGRWRLR